MRSKIALFAALFSVIWCLGVVWLHGDVSSSPEFDLPIDHHKYLAMAASDIGEFRVAPFCWRIGSPVLSRLLGFGDIWIGFRVVAILGVTLATVFSCLLVWDRTRSMLATAGCAITLLGCGWITRSSMWDPATVDSLAIGIVALATYLISRDRFGWALLALIAGAFVKESTLIVILIAPLVSSIGKRRYAFLSAVPAVLVVIALRMTIDAGNNDSVYLATLTHAQRVVQNGVSTYSLSYLIQNIALQRVSEFGPRELYAVSLDSFGAVTVGGFLLAFKRSVVGKWLMVLILAGSFSQILLASNIQRPVLIAAPFAVSYVWYACIKGVSFRHEVAWLLVAIALFCCTTVLQRTSPASWIQLPMFIVTVVLVWIDDRVNAQRGARVSEVVARYF